jgi:hypothetical protein
VTGKDSDNDIVVSPAATAHQYSIEEVRRILADAEYDGIKDKVDRAERALDDLKALLVHAPLLHDGRLSTGTIDYAAFRVQTLSLIFETARRSFRRTSKGSDIPYTQFLSELGDEVGLTFAWDLMNRLENHNLLLPFQDMKKLLQLWASFENDTGAGETEITQYSPQRVTIRLAKNPLRRAETDPHAHCGFYKNYIASLINEIFKIRARFLQSTVQGADVRAQNVASVREEPDARDECVFILTCRPEKLAHAFDLLIEAYNQYYRLEPQEDFSNCMHKARGALISAQMGAIGLSDERQPRQLHAVYKGEVSGEIFKLMDESYQRVSKVLHTESKSSVRMERSHAWRLLLDIRKCVYALEALDLDETKQEIFRNQAKRVERIAAIEEFADKAQDLPAADRRELKEVLSHLRKGMDLSEERQATFAAVVRKIGSKAWEVAKPVLSEVLTASVKREFGLE